MRAAASRFVRPDVHSASVPRRSMTTRRARAAGSRNRVKTRRAESPRIPRMRHDLSTRMLSGDQLTRGRSAFRAGRGCGPRRACHDHPRHGVVERAKHARHGVGKIGRVLAVRSAGVVDGVDRSSPDRIPANRWAGETGVKVFRRHETRAKANTPANRHCSSLCAYRPRQRRRHDRRQE